jgi:MYXO-CTERM domain-containing protein
MMLSTVRKLLCSTPLVVAAALGIAGSAQAATVTGRFDPIFGATLGNVGYRGTATFQIADACLSLGGPTSGAGGAFVYAGFDCDGGGAGTDAGMKFLGAHVDFFDPSNTSIIWGSVDFVLDPNAILGMFVQNNAVIGVQSGVIGAATSVWTINAPADLNFFIQFGIAGYVATDPFESHAPQSPFPGDGDNDLDDQLPSAFQATTMFQQVGGCTPTASTGACAASNPATTVYVAEPASSTLALAALAALCGAGAVRRRRA